MAALTRNQKLECALGALRAHGNNDATDAWYRRWMPDYHALNIQRHEKQCPGCVFTAGGGEAGHNYPGLPTTVQMSLSCILVEDALKLCA